jgi:flagellar basal-body rod protein FlgB
MRSRKEFTMPLQLLENLKFHGQALLLRAERQAVLAANIANADTPNYKARDIDFSQALAKATGRTGRPTDIGGGVEPRPILNGSHGQHLSAQLSDGNTLGAAPLRYRQAEQASGDGNSVDMDRERANFADNAIHYEATLRFVNSSVRTMLSAIRGD